MIDLAVLLPYVLACLLFSIIPGPSVTVVVANSLARGTKAGLLTILGTEIAMLSMVFIVAVGLDAVMKLVSEAFTIIKLAGAAYLVWIGLQHVHQLRQARHGHAPVIACRSVATSGREC